MKFYICWTTTDPVFCEYFKNCNILISPHNVSGAFNLNRWNNKPDNLIIDSGAYYYLSNNNKFPNQKDIFKKQLKIIQGYKGNGYICQLDKPIPSDNPSIENVYRDIETTLGNAYEFLELMKKHKVQETYGLKPMGVIQGNNKESIQYCARELKMMGYEYFGLGSLAVLFSKEAILERIKYASEIVEGENIHLFGVSRMDVIEDLNKLNISSMDSSRPIKAAIFSRVFYSKPFKIYTIEKSRNSKSTSSILKRPLECNCPICKVDSNLLVEEVTTRKSIDARGIHNYYHMHNEIESYLYTKLESRL